ncbi:YdbL family protein [Thiobacter aerophilum]|uniref:YdbL family protein n=1 Tax=Thiobacter aerophilum TaxID=3121275 RepID=A0ABV0EGQ0_9BURK
MKRAPASLLGLCLMLLSLCAYAQGANLDIDTPTIAAIKTAQQARHAQLKPFYDNGALGLTRDGLIALRDASLVPLAQRAAVQALVAEENRDRVALYREIARANGHPEWEADIRATFASRWIAKAPSGWYVQNANGEWVRK